MIVAEFLRADAVVVPISTNDAIDRGPLARVIEPKAKIVSPYVIAGMQRALFKGRHRVSGWEANGGFLTGSDIERNGNVLTARCDAASALRFVHGEQPPDHAAGTFCYAAPSFQPCRIDSEFPSCIEQENHRVLFTP